MTRDEFMQEAEVGDLCMFLLYKSSYHETRLSARPYVIDEFRELYVIVNEIDGRVAGKLNYSRIAQVL